MFAELLPAVVAATGGATAMLMVAAVVTKRHRRGLFVASSTMATVTAALMIIAIGIAGHSVVFPTIFFLPVVTFLGWSLHQPRIPRPPRDLRRPASSRPPAKPPTWPSPVAEQPAAASSPPPPAEQQPATEDALRAHQADNRKRMIIRHRERQQLVDQLRREYGGRFVYAEEDHDGMVYVILRGGHLVFWTKRTAGQQT